MGVRQLVQHNQRIEQSEHHEHRTLLSKRSRIMQQEIAFLANQLTKIHAAQADTLFSQNQPTVTPGVSPSPTPLSRSSQKCLTNSYLHMVLLMSKNPTDHDIRLLKESQAGNLPKMKEQLNALKPGKPIPDEVMKQLLKKRDLGRLWIDVRNPDVDVKETSSARTAPSPFSMNPFKQTPH